MLRDLLPRRTVLKSLSAVPLTALGAGVVLPALAGPPLSNDLDTIWRKALVARGAMNAAAAAYSQASDQMPWWAKPGPSRVNSAGEFCGGECYSPAIQDYTLPEGSIHRQIRVTEHDIQVLFGHEHGLFGDHAVRRRDERLASLRAREAAQRVEEERVGLPELDKQSELAGDASWECDHAILQLPLTGLDVLAAQIMVTMIMDCGTKDTAEGDVAAGIAALALKGLLPHLSGELALDACEVVSNPEREIGEMRSFRGTRL